MKSSLGCKRIHTVEDLHTSCSWALPSHPSGPQTTEQASLGRFLGLTCWTACARHLRGGRLQDPKKKTGALRQCRVLLQELQGLVCPEGGVPPRGGGTGRCEVPGSSKVLRGRSSVR
eukprot:scaffold92309_cov21-Tisochrysis_lutea.AAC.2